MSPRLTHAAVALALVGTGWFTGTSAAAAPVTPFIHDASSRATATLGRPRLVTWSQSPRPGVRARSDIRLHIPATAAELGKVTLYVPAGYGLNLISPPGTIQGHFFLLTGSDIAVGDLEAVSAAAYVNTEQAQACAPGPHAAVWVMPLDFLISSARAAVPVYLDPTTGAETALGAYKLQTCLPLAIIPSPGGWPIGSKVSDLILDFTHITNPAAAAVYVWRAFVSSPDDSGNPDPPTTYELRSDVPLPATLTLAGSFDRKHRRALLNGRYTTQTLPTDGISIALYRVTRTGTRMQVATTRTSTDGSYHFVRRMAKTSTYATEAFGIGDCTGAPTAPRGCADETRGAIDSSTTRIIVPPRKH